jgi:hypothetical protein
VDGFDHLRWLRAHLGEKNHYLPEYQRGAPDDLATAYRQASFCAAGANLVCEYLGKGRDLPHFGLVAGDLAGAVAEAGPVIDALGPELVEARGGRLYRLQDQHFPSALYAAAAVCRMVLHNLAVSSGGLPTYEGGRWRYLFGALDAPFAQDGAGERFREGLYLDRPRMPCNITPLVATIRVEADAVLRRRLELRETVGGGVGAALAMARQRRELAGRKCPGPPRPVQPPAVANAVPWRPEDLAGLQPVPRSLITFMAGRTEAPLAAVCRAVWGEEPADVSDDAIKGAVRKGNHFLRRNAGCCLSYSRKDGRVTRE